MTVKRIGDEIHATGAHGVAMLLRLDGSSELTVGGQRLVVSSEENEALQALSAEALAYLAANNIAFPGVASKAN